MNLGLDYDSRGPMIWAVKNLESKRHVYYKPDWFEFLWLAGLQKRQSSSSSSPWQFPLKLLCTSSSSQRTNKAAFSNSDEAEGWKIFGLLWNIQVEAEYWNYLNLLSVCRFAVSISILPIHFWLSLF